MVDGVYRPEELIDAVVIDSEGYIYGYVKGIEIQERDVLLEIYEKRRYVTEVVDEKKLLDMLLEEFSKRKRGIRRPKLSDLLEDIRKTLGILDRAELSLKDYMEYIEKKKMKVEIPKKKETLERKHAKGEVSVKEVRAIWVGDVPTSDAKGFKRYRIILLETPRQARYANIRAPQQPPYYPPERIRGKLVLDPSAKVIGYADDLLIGPKFVGLRVKLPPVVKRGINLEALAIDLKSYQEYSEYADRIRAYLKSHHSEYSPSHVDYGSLQRVVEWMREEKFPKEIIDSLVNYVEDIPVTKSQFYNIPWEAIEKIGDVVLLKDEWKNLLVE